MTLITDGLMIAAAVFAGAYCFVLSRRLRALKDLDSGLGGAITGMTRALEEARRALEDAKTASRDGNKDLKELIVRAEAASGQLRILLSATRDLPTTRGQARPAAKQAQLARAPGPDDEEAAGAQATGAPRPSAGAARREPPPLGAPDVSAPVLAPLDRNQRSAESPLRSRPAAAPASANEDDLLAALADFAGARS